MTMLPKKALVLAAGLGTRLRPLTETCPKPLLPVWNLPLLERVLRLLESWGVEEIAVNLHWHPERIQAYLAARAGSAKIRCSFEPEILGTGGALRPVRDFLGGEPFWVMNADIAAAVDPAPFVAAFERGGKFAATWLEPKKGPRTVEADRRGRVTCYRSPTPAVAGTYTLCGLHLLSPDVFAYLPEDKPFCTLVEVFERAMENGVFVDSVVVRDSYWDDAGTVESLLRIHADAKRLARAGHAGGALYDAAADRLAERATSFFCVGPEASVGAKAKGRDSVVWGRARVADGAALKHCVVTGGEVCGTVENAACVGADAVTDDALPAALAALGWRAETTAAAALGARGSNRTFWRLYGNGGSAIYVRYTDERPENLRYAGHARLLASAGVPVPAVRVDLPGPHALVLEDWGDESLQLLMERHADRAEALYRPVVEALARLHREGTQAVDRTGTPLEPPFDAALYAWEHRLFEENLLVKRYGYEALPENVRAELKKVAQRLEAAKQAVIHRDFQSSNVLFRGKRFVFIDFQGMRRGSAAYDLASLLYDPYVKLTPEIRTRLAAHYGKCCPEHPEAVELFFEGAVQRLVQALGAYGRLAGLGLSGFVRHIEPALENLLEAADACELDALGSLAEELIAREQARCGR
jgi:NDP-sugar pyrophosphorylase family protein/aminoglycoside/choline kinase family phosphotransferase